MFTLILKKDKYLLQKCVGGFFLMCVCELVCVCMIVCMYVCIYVYCVVIKASIFRKHLMSHSTHFNSYISQRYNYEIKLTHILTVISVI